MATRAEQEKSALDAYKAHIVEFVDSNLKNYEPDKEPDRRFSSKELNDSVWGTIQLTPAEVILLDSPLVQRLG